MGGERIFGLTRQTGDDGLRGGRGVAVGTSEQFASAGRNILFRWSHREAEGCRGRVVVVVHGMSRCIISGEPITASDLGWIGESVCRLSRMLSGRLFECLSNRIRLR